MQITRAKVFFIVLTSLALAVLMPFAAYADSDSSSASANNKFYFSEKFNTGLDNGYSETNQIKDDDPHFGWDLGQFVVSGFTSRAGDDSVPIFLKNAGDKVKLSFVLEQSIDALNGDSEKTISDDTNGQDRYFEIPKSENGFGHGTLIVRHTNYQNESTDPQVYNDYLKALEVGAETEVELFEEGDYEVALDYEVQSPGLIPFGPAYNNYRIYFKFKVRNSNTMMFLFDTVTNDELFNGSVTSNGFRVDLAGSHYLDVSVKKEVLNPSGSGLTEDTRFNKNATDGAVFDEEGIYTIKVKNPNTGEEPTEKRIYVGNNVVLKAAVANQMSVEEVQNKLNSGDTIDESGLFTDATAGKSNASDENGNDSGGSGDIEIKLVVSIVVVVLLILACVLIAGRRKLRGKPAVKTDAEEVEAMEQPRQIEGRCSDDDSSRDGDL